MRYLPAVSTFLAAAFVASSWGARAQSVYGTGGLFVNPTANMPPVGQVEPSTLVLSEHVPFSTPAERYRQTAWISSGVDYGFSPRIELGTAAVTITNAPGAGNASLGGYAKYLLVEEKGYRPAMALGATYLGGGQTGFRETFLALRKRVATSPFTAHAGVQYVDEADGFYKHNWEPFVGMDVKIHSGWSASAEARPRLALENGQPLALTLSHSAGGYNLAFTWANNGPGSTPQFGFGVGLALGSRR